MRLIIEHDNGKTETFQDLTDLYVAFVQQQSVVMKKRLHLTCVTRSLSWGNNLRELVKEVQQSLTELQLYLKEKGTSERSS